MRKNGFKKDIPALPPHNFFHVNIYLLTSNHTVFLFHFGINLSFFAGAAHAISAFGRTHAN